MSPSVSVIVPCYRSGQWVEEAVDSILAQTYRDWECLLIDDGSEDEPTCEALQRIAHRGEKRIRILSHDGHANRGVSVSRNLGLDHAKGRFVAFLDSDDAWLPDKLERQVSVLERAPDHVGLVFCDFWECHHPDPNEPMASQRLIPNFWGEPLARWFDGSLGKTFEVMVREPQGRFFNWVQSPTPLVRRSCFGRNIRFVGPPTLPTQFEDYLMWLMLATQYDFIALPAPLAIYRIHPEAFTSRFHQEKKTLALRRFEGMDAVVNLVAGSGASKSQIEALKAKWCQEAVSGVARAHGKLVRRLAVFSFRNRCFGAFSMAMIRRWFNQVQNAIRRTRLFAWSRALVVHARQGHS